jgi:hypothetical protein
MRSTEKRMQVRQMISIRGEISYTDFPSGFFFYYARIECTI